MEIPRPTPSDGLAPHELVQQRVYVNRALTDLRATRRLSRTGSASYRDVRVAKRAFMKAQRKLEQTCLASQQGLVTVPAP